MDAHHFKPKILQRLHFNHDYSPNGSFMNKKVYGQEVNLKEGVGLKVNNIQDECKNASDHDWKWLGTRFKEKKEG